MGGNGTWMGGTVSSGVGFHAISPRARMMRMKAICGDWEALQLMAGKRFDAAALDDDDGRDSHLLASSQSWCRGLWSPDTTANSSTSFCVKVLTFWNFWPTSTPAAATRGEEPSENCRVAAPAAAAGAAASDIASGSRLSC